jgi:hypothetical protein
LTMQTLIARAKAILMTPNSQWPLLAAAPETIGGLYLRYLVILAAIPALVHLLSASVIGISIPILGSYRVGFWSGLLGAIITYVVTLAGLYLLGIIIDLLAPRFGGTRNRVQALKSAAFPYTATAAAAVIGLIPGLHILAVLAGAAYSIYLLKLGLPYTMGCPPQKSGVYTAAIVVCSFLIGVVLGPLTALSLALVQKADVPGLSEAGRFDRGSLGGQLEELATTMQNNMNATSTPELPKTEHRGTGIEQWTAKVDAASRALDAAKDSGDSKAQADAVSQMLGAVLGNGGKVAALAPDKIKAFAPEVLGGLKRASLTSERNAAMGVQLSTATAKYADGQRHLTLEITDTGTLKGLVGFAQGWAGLEQERETDSGSEKTYKSQGRLTHEKWDNKQHRGEYGLVIGERFSVKVSGDTATLDDLKQAMATIDLAGLEALKNEGIQHN